MNSCYALEEPLKVIDIIQLELSSSQLYNFSVKLPGSHDTTVPSVPLSLLNKGLSIF